MSKSQSKMIVIISLFIFTAGACSPEPQFFKEGRETVLDQVVFVEEGLILDIPHVARWCESLELKKGKVSIGDCELYVEEAGKGTPIVLINGGPGGTHHTFHPEFSKAEKFARVVYYDQRGCGLSDYKKGEGYTIDQAVNDLNELRRVLKIDKWVVLGWSYGGFLAQYYALKHPENILGLVLVASAVTSEIPFEYSRSNDYISQEERKKYFSLIEMLREEKLTVPQFLYNAHLNGDWKQQNYYKPTVDELAELVLYEWVHADDFRYEIGNSKSDVYIEGAFRNCPIPTLLLEAQWDLTWNIDRPEKMQELFPNARFVLFNESGHRMFGDEPELFFKVLKRFVKNIPDVEREKIEMWKADLKNWEKEKEKTVSVIKLIQSLGEGREGRTKLVNAFERSWLDKLENQNHLNEVAYALYDEKKYEDAFWTFKRRVEILQNWKDKSKGNALLGISMIWQGHMLDLMGRREEAVSVYKTVVGMNITDDSWSHSSYGIQYKPTISGYASKFISVPFERIERKN